MNIYFLILMILRGNQKAADKLIDGKTERQKTGKQVYQIKHRIVGNIMLYIAKVENLNGF